MNTPSHLLLSLAALRRGDWRPLLWPIAIGAVIADLPMFGFYLYQRWYIGLPEKALWEDLYFRPEWQLLFDSSHSIPLVATILVVAASRESRIWMAFATSWMLHLAFDLPLHHTDAHRHFLPLSSFRLESPISYWDPAHLGAYGAAAEVVLVAICSYRVGRDSPRLWVRILLGSWVALSAGVWVALYVFGLVPN